MRWWRTRSDHESRNLWSDPKAPAFQFRHRHQQQQSPSPHTILLSPTLPPHGRWGCTRHHHTRVTPDPTRIGGRSRREEARSAGEFAERNPPAAGEAGARRLLRQRMRPMHLGCVLWGARRIQQALQTGSQPKILVVYFFFSLFFTIFSIANSTIHNSQLKRFVVTVRRFLKIMSWCCLCIFNFVSGCCTVTIGNWNESKFREYRMNMSFVYCSLAKSLEYSAF